MASIAKIETIAGALNDYASAVKVITWLTENSLLYTHTGGMHHAYKQMAHCSNGILAGVVYAGVLHAAGGGKVKCDLCGTAEAVDCRLLCDSCANAIQRLLLVAYWQECRPAETATQFIDRVLTAPMRKASC